MKNWSDVQPNQMRKKYALQMQEINKRQKISSIHTWIIYKKKK
jgi:hypothetical protein